MSTADDAAKRKLNEEFTEGGSESFRRRKKGKEGKEAGERAGHSDGASRARSAKEGERSAESLRVPVPDPRMYVGVLGEIVTAADPSTEADPVGVYASLLSGSGMAIGPRPHVQVGNTRHPLLVWSLLFGRTGAGRKGEATETAEAFLFKAVPDLHVLKVTGLSSGEGLVERLRDQEDPEDEGGTMDKRLLVLEPEFSSVMARTKRDGSTLASILRQAWDGKQLSVLNRRALRASSSHVAIIGHITPKEFRLRAAESEMAGGTYNRFLPLYVEQSKKLPIPDGVDETVKASLGKQLGDAITEAAKFERIQLDRSATELWVGELYDEMTAADDEDEAWTEFTRRAAPYCLRIAALTAVLDGRRIIHDADLQAAAALVRYAIASARYVLENQQRDPRLDRLCRKLEAAGSEGLSRAEISCLFSRKLPKTVLNELLQTLVDSGRYERFEVKTAGRPAERYRVRTAAEDPQGSAGS